MNIYLYIILGITEPKAVANASTQIDIQSQNRIRDKINDNSNKYI
jgi:hypothetical protein